MTPLVSVIMPAYNAMKTIEQSVQSVLAQTYKNFELIIVDDGSTDGTGNFIDIYENEKIRAFHIDNKGVGRARNFAISKAEGDYIAFLDADDLWTKDKLEKQISFMEKNNWPSLSFTASSFMKEDDSLLSYELHVPKTISFDELLKQNVISCSSVIAKKEILMSHPFPQEDVIHEDFAVWLSILKDGAKAYGLDEPLLIYRLSSSGKSSNKLEAALMNWHTYRYLGLSLLVSFQSMVSYTVRGLKKYSKLK